MYTPEQVQAVARAMQTDDAEHYVADAAHMLEDYAATLRQAPAQGGVTEAMVEELIAAGDFLAINGTDGMVRRWEKAKAALSAQGQGDLQPEDSRCPPTYRREEAVKALIGMGWSWDGKQWSAPPAQPAERVPEGTWLWCKLMDWCKARRVPPAEYSDLFAIAGEAHKLAASPTSAAQGQPGGVDGGVG